MKLWRNNWSCRWEKRTWGRRGAKRIRTVNGAFLKVDETSLVGNESSAGLIVDLVDLPARNGIIHVIDFVLLD